MPTLAGKHAHFVATVMLMPFCGLISFAEVPLDLHDARLLVEHTPVFLEAVNEGLCPQTSDAAITADVATVIIRGGCRTYPFIGGLYVNLDNGAITRDGGALGPTIVETKELTALREKLFAMRADRRLSASEAVCLLERVAVASVVPSCRRASIQHENDDVFVAAIESICTNPKQSISLTLDRYDGSVSDKTTGQLYPLAGA
jgi:hypothetical protein